MGRSRRPYLAEAKQTATRPVKQAVISASALSLTIRRMESTLSAGAFIADLVNEARRYPPLPRRGSLLRPDDFTKRGLSLKLDPRLGCCAASST